MACACVKASLDTAPAFPSGFEGLCVHSKVPVVLLPPPVPPAQPPRRALGKWWGTLVQVWASRGGPAVSNLQAAAPQEKGGKAGVQPGTKALLQ